MLTGKHTNYCFSLACICHKAWSNLLQLVMSCWDNLAAVSLPDLHDINTANSVSPFTTCSSWAAKVASTICYILNSLVSCKGVLGYSTLALVAWAQKFALAGQLAVPQLPPDFRQLSSAFAWSLADISCVSNLNLPASDLIMGLLPPTMSCCWDCYST